jgi:hypothetical protein
MKVSEAKATLRVGNTTKYGHLRQQADNIGTAALVVSHLRRENANLKEIIVMLSLEKRWVE